MGIRSKGNGVAKIDFPNVVRKRSKGKVYYYYRLRKAGKDTYTRLRGEPGSAVFARHHEELHRPKRAAETGAHSFSRLIASYLGSSDFAARSTRTQKDYRQYLSIIDAACGDLSAADWTRSDVLEMREHYIETPRKAKYLLQMMSILMQLAIDKGWRESNPAARVKAPKTLAGLPHWPADKIEAILATASGAVLLGLRVALAIGPRPGDLVKLMWSDFDLDDAVVSYTQSKTGEGVCAPLMPDMIEYLRMERRHARGVYLLTDKHGRPLNYGQFEYKFRQVRDRAGCKGYSLHGFRKNATMTLSEAGATEAQIMAATGHKTSEMIKLYGKAANKKRLAKAAGGKLFEMGGNSKSP